MTSKPMTVIERLQNPAWESDRSGDPYHPARLNTEQTLDVMALAIAEIESLQEALNDALNPRR
jgi:hypothetical protein